MRRLKTPADVMAVVKSEAPDTIPTLLNALGHSDPQVRYSAFAALGDFGEPGFLAIINTLLTGNIRQREAIAAYLGDWNDERAVLPLLYAIDKAEKERGVPVLYGCLGVFFLVPALALYILIKLGVLPILQDGRKVVLNAVWSLGKLGDVRAIGKMAYLARTTHRSDLRSFSRSALLNMLPKVRDLMPEQAYMLGPNAIVEMAQMLRMGEAPEIIELNFGLLDALAAVGDRRAIPAVQRLIPSLPPSGLRRQAETTLTILMERAAQEEARLTLLRGSDAGAPPDQLLRPTYGQPAAVTAPEQLLRVAAYPTERQRPEER